MKILVPVFKVCKCKVENEGSFVYFMMTTFVILKCYVLKMKDN